MTSSVVAMNSAVAERSVSAPNVLAIIAPSEGVSPSVEFGLTYRVVVVLLSQKSGVIVEFTEVSSYLPFKVAIRLHKDAIGWEHLITWVLIDVIESVHWLGSEYVVLRVWVVWLSGKLRLFVLEEFSLSRGKVWLST